MGTGKSWTRAPLVHCVNKQTTASRAVRTAINLFKHAGSQAVKHQVCFDPEPPNPSPFALRSRITKKPERPHTAGAVKYPAARYTNLSPGWNKNIVVQVSRLCRLPRSGEMRMGNRNDVDPRVELVNRTRWGRP